MDYPFENPTQILTYKWFKIKMEIFISEIEEQVRNLQQKKKKLQDGGAEEEDEANKVGLGAEGHYDTDIYSAHGKFEGYVTSIAPNEELDVSNMIFFKKFWFEHKAVLLKVGYVFFYNIGKLYRAFNLTNTL